MTATYLEHSAVPREDIRIDGGGVDAHMHTQHLLEELHGRGVLPALELPQLTRGEDRHHEVPLRAGELRGVIDDAVDEAPAAVGQVPDQQHLALLDGARRALLLHGDVHALKQEVFHVDHRDAGGERARQDDDGVALAEAAGAGGRGSGIGTAGPGVHRSSHGRRRSGVSRFAAGARSCGCRRALGGLHGLEDLVVEQLQHNREILHRENKL